MQFQKKKSTSHRWFGRGIGRSIAGSLVEYGNRVVVVDNKDVPDDIALEGDKTFFIKSDLSNPDNCKEVVKSALEHFRGIDILINNAGFQFVSPLEQSP